MPVRVNPGAWPITQHIQRAGALHLPTPEAADQANGESLQRHEMIN
jgi:hypothetical protein